MGEPIFVEEFRRRQFEQRLKQDPFTSWACGLTGPHLAGLLWSVGEVQSRGHVLLELFDTDPLLVTATHADAQKAKGQLECLIGFRGGIDIGEARRRFEDGRSKMTMSDLPENVRDRVERAAPGTNWTHISMSEFGYEFSRIGEPDGSRSLRVNYDGMLTFRTYTNEATVPAVVRSAIKRTFPDHVFGSNNAHEICNGNKEIVGYELWVYSRDGNSEWIAVSPDGESVTPARDLGRAQIFPETFRESLKIGKYTKWAVDLSEASLEALFWLLGALATETMPMLKPVEAYVDLVPWPDLNVLRPRIHFDAIFRTVTQGERFDTDQVVDDYFFSRMQQWRRACAEAVPVAVRHTVNRVLPEATKGRVGTSFDKNTEGYSFWGEDKQRRHFSVTVSHDGFRTTVHRQIVKDDVPPTVLAVLQKQITEIRVSVTAWAIGPTWQSVDQYEFITVSPRRHQKIIVSADGKVVDVKAS